MNIDALAGLTLVLTMGWGIYRKIDRVGDKLGSFQQEVIGRLTALETIIGLRQGEQHNDRTDQRFRR